MAINKISSFSNVKPMLRRATMVGVLGLTSIAGNIQAKPSAPQLDRDSYISQYIEQQQLSGNIQAKPSAPQLDRDSFISQYIEQQQLSGNIQAKPSAPQLDRDSFISQYIEQQQLRMAEKKKEQKEKNLVTFLGLAFACLGGFLTYALVLDQATTPPYSDKVNDKKK